MAKILVVDDEPRIVELIKDFLIGAGHSVLTAADGEEALRVFFENEPELVVLDIMMPGLDGWATAREIRKQSDVPILMLSARGEEFDMLEGFQSGIDEYVTKPFSPAVLVKRIEALLKRSGEKKPEQSDVLKVDRESFVATLYGNELDLTLKEFELLDYLNINKGHVLSREQLLCAVWGYDFDGDTRTVDSHIARLRTKLSDYGVSHLKTVYGLGYKLI